LASNRSIKVTAALPFIFSEKEFIEESGQEAMQMKVLRTPEECFDNLPDFPYEPHYFEFSDENLGSLRLHYIDTGPKSADPVLLMHGEPTWSFLYRKLIPIISAAGCRVVAPDMIGFGRSDKPALQEDYSYQHHVGWMQEFLDQASLENITLVCHDWGGLIGLRLVADNPQRFNRVVVANTFLPTGNKKMSEAFLNWQKFAKETDYFDVGRIVSMGSVKPLSPEVIAAYNAPFPDDSYKSGARVFPLLVPTSPDDPAAPANRKAWEVLQKFERPFLTAFSDSDPITGGRDLIFQKKVPGAKGQPHATLKGGGHFLQEDCGEELARLVVDFIRKSSA